MSALYGDIWPQPNVPSSASTRTKPTHSVHQLSIRTILTTSHHDHVSQRLAGPHRRHRVVDAIDRVRAGDQLVQADPAVAVEGGDARDLARRLDPPHLGADDTLAVVRQLGGVDASPLAGRRHAG